MSRIRLTVDPELCMGSGTCLAVAAELFDMGVDGAARPIHALIEPNTKLDEAISRCPTAAIAATPAKPPE
jgi:ferredoxin